MSARSRIRTFVFPIYAFLFLSCDPALIQQISAKNFPVTSNTQTSLVAHFAFEGDLNATRGSATISSFVTFDYAAAATGDGIDTRRGDIAADAGVDLEYEIECIHVDALGFDGDRLESHTISYWSTLQRVWLRWHQASEEWHTFIYTVLAAPFGDDSEAINFSIFRRGGWNWLRSSDTLTGTWHHIAIVYDEVQTIWLFVDGKMRGAARFDAPIEAAGEFYLELGVHDYHRSDDPISPDERFQIDELIVFRGVLSVSEIESLYLGTINLDEYPL